MEEKIRIGANDNLESIVYTLLAAKARGEHVYCVFKGHELHSDNVTMEQAYTEVMGCTKAEYWQRMKAWSESFDKEEKERKEREALYAKKVKESRTEEKKIITSEEVISGLKFIAENQSMNQEELIDGLIELGCNFSLEDIEKQFPEQINLFKGMKKGNINCGALVIANIRDSENSRAYCEDRFLGIDDNTSIYHFIRVRTGDKTYTKENIDSLNNAPRRHR